MTNTAEKGLRGVLLLVLIAGLASCTGTKSVSEERAGSAESTPSEAQIIFLNYSIKKKPDNSFHIELISKIVAEGSLKPGIEQDAEPEGGDLSCLTLDKDKRPLSTQAIPDPLKRRVEYQLEDGSLTSREITMDSTVFSVRIQLNKASRFVALKQSDSPGGTYLIINEIDDL